MGRTNCAETPVQGEAPDIGEGVEVLWRAWIDVEGPVQRRERRCGVREWLAGVV